MSQIGILPASKWLQNFDCRDPKIHLRMQEIYGSNSEILNSRYKIYLRALETFTQHYSSDRPVLISRAPARINLLGNHIDHRGGHVNYMAVNRETLLVAAVRGDDCVSIHNANAERFEPRSFQIGERLPPDRRGNWLRFIEEIDLVQGDWGNYIQAAVLHLQDQFSQHSLRGMDLAVAGDVPIAAGLSSSSTLVVSALEASLRFNDLQIPFNEKAAFCGRAEWLVGTRGGSGDHAAMIHATRQSVVSLQFFPLNMVLVPFHVDYRVVACNSHVEHAAPGIFNERIATYEIGLHLIRERYPEFADRLVHLRDLNTGNLDISLAEIYQILQSLPERMSRKEIRALLPDRLEEIETLFSPHAEPKEGYRIRQVVLFGLAECSRAELCAKLLKKGKMAEFGELKYLSHDGDRRFDFAPDPVPIDNHVGDAALGNLISDLESGDTTRVNHAQIHLQPGGYDCSCQELDHLVHLARKVEGVVGAGLAGGGLGGCVLAVVHKDAVQSLIDTLNEEFYTPKGLSDGTLVCTSVAGSGLF